MAGWRGVPKRRVRGRSKMEENGALEASRANTAGPRGTRTISVTHPPKTEKTEKKRLAAIRPTGRKPKTAKNTACALS